MGTHKPLDALKEAIKQTLLITNDLEKRIQNIEQMLNEDQTRSIDFEHYTNDKFKKNDEDHEGLLIWIRDLDKDVAPYGWTGALGSPRRPITEAEHRQSSRHHNRITNGGRRKSKRRNSRRK